MASTKVGLSLWNVNLEFINFIFDNDPIKNKDTLAEYVDTIDKLENVQAKLGKMISEMTWI